MSVSQYALEGFSPKRSMSVSTYTTSSRIHKVLQKIVEKMICPSEMISEKRWKGKKEKRTKERRKTEL